MLVIVPLLQMRLRPRQTVAPMRVVGTVLPAPAPEERDHSSALHQHAFRRLDSALHRTGTRLKTAALSSSVREVWRRMLLRVAASRCRRAASSAMMRV